MTDIKTIFHEQQEKAVDTVADWSKWMIGLTFSSGTGCMIVLQQGVSSAIKPYLVGAIFFLAVSILMSIVIYSSLPTIIQQLPVKANADKGSIYDYKVLSGISLRMLVALQILLFVLGIVFLFIWVVLKPAR